MSTKSLVLIALFAAITAALAVFPPIILPVIGVPITAQSMGPMLAGAILGARRGGLSQVLFLVLVAVGLPLLSGGRGGFGVFFGASGGFILSWPLAALVVGVLIERQWAGLSIVTAVLSCALGGIVLVYAIGIPWIAFVAKIDLMKAAIGSSAFIPGDLIKAIVAGSVSMAVRKAYPIIGE